MSTPLQLAERSYHRCVFAGDAGEVDAALRGLVGDAPATLLARGKLLHARFLVDRDAADEPDRREESACFDRALAGFRVAGDRCGQAQALFWQGCYWQVVAGDHARADGPLAAAAQLSQECGDDLTRSYALRHLGIAKHRAGEPRAAREFLEQSTRLRRELAFAEGVAANLVGLSYIALGEGRSDDAIRHADEAAELARRAGADAVLGQAEAARAAAG